MGKNRYFSCQEKVCWREFPPSFDMLDMLVPSTPQDFAVNSPFPGDGAKEATCPAIRGKHGDLHAVEGTQPL